MFPHQSSSGAEGRASGSARSGLLARDETAEAMVAAYGVKLSDNVLLHGSSTGIEPTVKVF